MHFNTQTLLFLAAAALAATTASATPTEQNANSNPVLVPRQFGGYFSGAKCIDKTGSCCSDFVARGNGKESDACIGCNKGQTCCNTEYGPDDSTAKSAGEKACSST